MLPIQQLHTLEHLSILFQPLLAEAWASEKITGTVDTSNELLEVELRDLRNSLPFVREPMVRQEL